MSIRETQRDLVVARLTAYVLEQGLARTSLRQLAAAAGVSDRMLLYYFADKTEILETVLTRIATTLGDALAQALPEGACYTPAEMLQRAAAITTQPDMRHFMRFWVEVVSAAAKGEAPFATIAPQIMQGWQVWVESRLIVPEGADRAGLALAIIAMVDGLALVDICAGPDAAAAAHTALPRLVP